MEITQRGERRAAVRGLDRVDEQVRHARRLGCRARVAADRELDQPTDAQRMRLEMSEARAARDEDDLVAGLREMGREDAAERARAEDYTTHVSARDRFPARR